MKTVLCFGDSITWGFNPLIGHRHNYENRWTTVLQSQLGDWKLINQLTCWFLCWVGQWFLRFSRRSNPNNLSFKNPENNSECEGKCREYKVT